MKRLEKLTGVGNVQMVEVEVPSPGPQDALVKVKRSLISRGSELFARYVKEEAVSPEIMGYSDAGAIVDVGAAVAEVQPEQLAPLGSLSRQSSDMPSIWWPAGTVAVAPAASSIVGNTSRSLS